VITNQEEMVTSSVTAGFLMVPYKILDSLQPQHTGIMINHQELLKILQTGKKRVK
jgi:hypothetical protein